MMSEMISVASGFQYSVNIGYDLNNDAKLKNFIPTQSALQLLSDVLDSTAVTSTERSRILIGAYGKGKSHIVLMILSMLLKKDLSLFEKTMPKISENPRLLQSVHNYYDSSEKILPVVITGSSTSLTQAFIIALQRTLSDNGLLDIMPETNYRAAIAVIDRWKSEFPQTYKLFCNELISLSVFFLMNLQALIFLHTSVILESIPVESIDTLIEFGLNNANDDYYDDVYLADGCSTCKTEIFRSFLTQVATNTDEIFFELSNKLLRQALDEQLSKLTLKEAEVIKLRYGYYGKERTLEEVGKQFGVTRERIRQIETKAMVEVKQTA